MTTILVTGFGRFHGAPVNPSGVLVERIGRSRCPAFAGIELIPHVFPTSYAAVDQQLPNLLARHRPDAIVMFGLAARTKHLRIELQARNRTILFPDANGFSPKARLIRPHGPTTLVGRAAFSRVTAAARGAGVRAMLSHNAGSYVCNYLYWRAIEYGSPPKGPLVVFFVHVPSVQISRRSGRGRGSGFRFANLVRAAEAILRVALADLRRRK
jgi:pyroglutamyl-peptidase